MLPAHLPKKKWIVPPAPDCDDEAQLLLDVSGSTALGAALSVCEASDLTKAVLKSIGLGCHPLGIMLSQCTSAAEAADCRNEIGKHLMRADRRLDKLAGGTPSAARTANSLVAVGRMLVGLMAALAAADVPDEKKDGTGDTKYIVTQTEEERGFSLQAYDAEESKKGQAKLLKLHNIRLLPHECAAQPQQKKCAYWARNEGCFADPNKVPLSSFRRDELSDEQLGHITEVMYQLLHKATSTGQMSGSLSSVAQIAKMPEYLEAQRSAAPAGQHRKRGRGQEEPEVTTPDKKKKKKAAATPPAKREKGSRYEDVAGAMGPNKLPRKKGGNPDGERCKDFEGGTCSFKTCSYSHK